MTFDGNPSPLDAAWDLLETLSGTGGGRAASASEATSDLVARILSAAADIGITRLADLTGLDFLGLPVWAAYRPNGYVLSLAGGKGLTHASAQASALCEAIELDAAERHAGQIDATIDSLERQHGVASVLPMTGVARCSFDLIQRDKMLRWSLGANLLDGHRIWVPTELVALDDRKSSRETSGGWITGAFDSSSTGLGAGTERVTATLHALLELIEEDAMAIWRYAGTNAASEQAIEPNSFHSDTLTQLLEQLGAAGAVSRLFNATANDIAVPTIYAVIAGYPTGSYHDRIFGAGSCSHPHAETAAARALLEAAQSRIAYISGARDDLPVSLYENRGGSFPTSDWVMAARETQRAPIDFAEPDSDPRSLIAQLAVRLASAGVTRIAVVPLATSQTSQLGIEVVRVIADGLEIDTEGAARQLGQRGLAAFLRAAAGPAA